MRYAPSQSVLTRKAVLSLFVWKRRYAARRGKEGRSDGKIEGKPIADIVKYARGKGRKGFVRDGFERGRGK